MSRSLALFAIGALFGGTAGFLFAASNGVTLDGHDHGEHLAGDHGGAKHSGKHDELLPVIGGPVPTIDLAVSVDPLSGWNVNIKTTDFRFSPQNASRPHVAGEGHVHIYINGKKVGRHYSDWYHIAALPSGENTIKVTLNANDHRQLASADKGLEAIALIKAD